ncbi:MAG TPA: MOSC domain-containing protein [Thermoanaerobaculia bacterium]|jgi:hypothetical protein|nr:MOSC domain-containing protein [Thermoanaerobaculia bacterium]
MIEIGRVCELVRYPVKSMAGIPTESAVVGWQGLEGDRRFAFRRVGDESAFPFLTAGRLPRLIRYCPLGFDESSQVRTPEGSELGLRSAELQAEIGERFGSGVELMKYKHGIFDEAPMSVISLATIAGIGRETGVDLDRRRFRANVYLETDNTEVFQEDAWVGATLVFGNGDASAAVTITLRDERCMMVNLDPDTAEQDPRVMKAVVRMSGNYAGVYGTVVRTGTIRVGDRVRLVG